MNVRRRAFLKSAAVAGWSSPAAFSLSRPASAAGSASGKVVIVGAGFGGATAAKYLRMWSSGSLDVTVVEPNPEFISCPMSNLVLGGSKDLAYLTVSYENLVKRRHAFA